MSSQSDVLVPDALTDDFSRSLTAPINFQILLIIINSSTGQPKELRHYVTTIVCNEYMMQMDLTRIAPSFVPTAIYLSFRLNATDNTRSLLDTRSPSADKDRL